MILERLELERFGCFDRGAWDFAPGLNVISGPNEAGKSTMREAIVRLLFDHRRAVKTTDTDVLRWTRWGSTQDFRLSATFLAREARYRLTKDFEHDRIELAREDQAAPLVDEGEVTETLYDLLGVQSREVYTSTACLEQQQFAQLAAGRDISELLQQTVSGTGEGVGVQDVIARLDGQVADLARGLHRPARYLGPLAATQAEVEGLGRQVQDLAPVVHEAEDAAARIDTLTEQLSELQAELQRAEALRERADRQRKLADSHRELSERCLAKERDLRRARDLQQDLQRLDEQLAGAPDLTPEVAAQVRDLARDRDEARQQAQRRQQQAEHLAQEATTARSALEQAQAQLPASDALKHALRLRDDRESAQAASRDAEAAVADLRRRQDQARAAGRVRQALIAVGGLLVLAGAALGVLVSTGLWAVAAVGAAALLAALLRPAPHPLADLRDALEQAQADLGAANQAAQDRQEALDAICRQAGAADVQALMELAEAARVSLDEATAGSAAAGARAADASAEAAATAQRAEQLHQQLQSRLADLGFERLDAFQRAAEQVASLRDQRSAAHSTLQGILGDESVSDLEREFSALNADRMGLQEQLASPEVASAELSPDDYQGLLSRIGRLTAQQDELREGLDQARKLAERPDADPERLRSLQEQRASRQQRLQRLQERLQALELTSELLAEAHRATVTSAIQVLEPTMGRLLSDLTGGRYSEVRVDEATLAPQIFSPQKGAMMENLAQEMSCATREQVFLAARLALTRLLWPEEPPLVLMDDPLVNFDPRRRGAALELIRALAAEAQVLLFTCQHWYDDAADRVIPLD